MEAKALRIVRIRSCQRESPFARRTAIPRYLVRVVYALPVSWERPHADGPVQVAHSLATQLS